MTSMHTRIWLATGLAAFTIAMVPPTHVSSDERGARPHLPLAADTTLAEGAFTEAQVQRGSEVFAETCVECHSTSDMRGDDFMFNWGGSSVGRLYRTITRTMPEDDPGGLPTSDYLAVISYILELNGFPVGELELSSEAEMLNKLRIEH